jgi:hypothetical protein
MAISKSLVDTHAGLISAESDGLGLGAKFCVTLPSIHASTVQQSQVESDKSSKNTPKNVGRISILLVEDHEDTAEVIGRCFSATSDCRTELASILFAISVKTWQSLPSL